MSSPKGHFQSKIANTITNFFSRNSSVKEGTTTRKNINPRTRVSKLMNVVKTNTKENSAIGGCTSDIIEKRRIPGKKGRVSHIELINTGPSCVSVDNPIKISINTDTTNNGIGDNVLNDYINVQYNITFSMVPEDTVADIQAAIPKETKSPSETLITTLRRAKAVVLASTGSTNSDDIVLVNPIDQDRRAKNAKVDQVFKSNVSDLGSRGFAANKAEVESANFDPRDFGNTGDIAFSVADRNYYNITEMTIDNFQAPVANNPMISSMIGGSMIIAEPGGFSFNDDVKRLAKRIGYLNINGGRILYRLDIGFSGYNQNTGEWVQNIDIDIRKDYRIPFITYYVIITKFEAQVSNTGTVYNINFAPSGATAFRPEDFIVDSGGVFSRDTNTFGGFLKSLEVAMSTKRREETTEATTRKDGIVRTYEFIAPPVLLESKFLAAKWATHKTYVSESLDKGSIVYTGKDIDMLTLLKSAMDDIPVVQELFIAKVNDNDNKQFVRPRTHFTTRFNVIYGKPASELGDYYDMKIQIIIEPFVSFKKGSYTSETLGDYTDIKSQIRRVEQMQNIGAIVRKYDYINTSGNTEVIDFGINLSAFFYDSMDRSQDFPGTKGIGIAATGKDQSSNLGDVEFRKSAQIQLGTLITGDPGIDDGLVTQLGGSVSWENVTNNKLTPYEILGGGKGITPDINSFGSITSETPFTDARKDRYLREFQDWLTRDQMQLDDLTVRGDPIWLLSPYASADMNRINPLSDVIRPSTDKVIFININAPDQRNYMEPDANKRSNPNIIGGFYGVYSVSSIFNNGSFTQKINGYKINHLNYVEEGLRFEDIISTKTLTLSEAAGFSADITQLHPEELKLSRQAIERPLSPSTPAGVFNASVSSRFENVLEVRKKI